MLDFRPGLPQKISWLQGLLLGSLLCTQAAALVPQNGDREDEPQPAVDKNFDIPPAPILTPEEEKKTFQLPPGYRIELVASDPLIHDPVDFTFDEFGRLWVVEMRTLMLDADGTGEQEPKSSIAVLSDKDGDGYFEHRSVFADKLTLPRGIAFGFGGVIAVLPPKLVLMHDTDGDGKADKTETIDAGKAFAAGLENVEHAPNAPRLGLDNWLYLANHNRRYRKVDGKWIHSPVPRRGQWGMGQDDYGRHVYNYNPTPLHGDLVPPHYVLRNKALGRAKGTNERLIADSEIYPSRMNLGVNRAYRENHLTIDGRIKVYDAACGPVVYRGTALAPDDYGSTFACEPAGNLIRQNRMTEENGRISGQAVRGPLSFLTSTDERFRPVNLRNGPDGALYICDLYRGILQHRVFLTSFLRRQIEERGLDNGTGLGRIWRVVHTDGNLDTSPALGDQKNYDWVSVLQESKNGWRRSTAQRLLVEAGPAQAEQDWEKPKPFLEVPVRQDFSLDGADPPQPNLASKIIRRDFPNAKAALEFFNTSLLSSLHAAWVLEGLGLLPDGTIYRAAFESKHPRLQTQGIRLSENRSTPYLFKEWQKILTSLPQASGPVHWQLAHSIGPRIAAQEVAPPETDAPINPWDLAVQLLTGRDDDTMVRQGLLSGLALRELDLAERLDANFPKTLTSIGRLVAKRGNPAEYARLFDLANPQVLQGFVTSIEEKPPAPFTTSAPKSLAKLASNPDPKLAGLGTKIQTLLTFETTLSEADLDRQKSLAAILERGKNVYSITCAACHQTDGRGLPNLAPPLGDPTWLDKPDRDLIRIVTRGLSGEIKVEGKSWNLLMPPWAHLTDQQVADVLTYTLNTFGKGKAKERVFDAETVKAER